MRGLLDPPSLLLGVLVAVAGAWMLGGPPALWTLAGLGVALGAAAAQWWWHNRGPGAALAGLAATWAELPGASLRGSVVTVFHGTQPLEIRPGRDGRDGGALRVTVETPVGQRPVAFRVWPRALSAPPLPAPPPGPGPSVTVTPADLERVATVEAGFAGALRVEASDPGWAERMLVGAPALALARAAMEHPESFAGITYDGVRMGVHLMGPAALDPARGARLARDIWEPFLG